MKKLLAVSLISLSLTGCASIVEMIPSFWDDNQSAKIIDIRQAVQEITCEPGTQLDDAEMVLYEIQWFKLYSESKGSRQKDVLRIVAPMEETARDWAKRSREKEGSKTYCEIKKKLLVQQSSRAAEAILGRF
jgi:flagellar basal body L-ring protein FlgH